MTQPLVGDNSVLGICLICVSGGFFSFKQMEIVLSSEEIVLPQRQSVTVTQFFQESRPYGALLQSNQMFPIIRPKPDGFCLQIVGGADEAHRPALRAHQNGIRGGRSTLPS